MINQLLFKRQNPWSEFYWFQLPFWSSWFHTSMISFYNGKIAFFTRFSHPQSSSDIFQKDSSSFIYFWSSGEFSSKVEFIHWETKFLVKSRVILSSEWAGSFFSLYRKKQNSQTIECHVSQNIRIKLNSRFLFLLIPARRNYFCLPWIFETIHVNRTWFPE